MKRICEGADKLSAREERRTEPEILMVSSVFGAPKLAEPMGAAILTACLRQSGFRADILDPSLDGLSPTEAAVAAARRQPKVLGLSMLRDKNVEDVLEFLRAYRSAAPSSFVIIGGHGPSIAVGDISRDAIEANRQRLNAQGTGPAHIRREALESSCGTTLRPAIQPMKFHLKGALVDNDVVGRGLGPATEPQACSASAQSPYYDKSAEYLQMLDFADAFMLGESDVSFPALVRTVLEGGDWRIHPGLAFLNTAFELVLTPRPPKIAELDSVPFMARDILAEYVKRHGRKIPASILASRGCNYRCTFCSVVKYENLQDGKSHRFRSNRNIVDEIKLLRQTFGVRNFNFEDDNFILKNKSGVAKLNDLCNLLATEVPDIEFSIFCRADAVQHDLFANLRRAGLSSVYLGIESVYPGDLEFFHKGVSLSDNERAFSILEQLGFSAGVDSDLRIMLGFITWHPLTSFGSLRAASRFIRAHNAPAKLLRRKLRLYAGTEIITNVVRLGLLNPNHPDGWNFKDSRVEGLDKYVDNFALKTNSSRDMLRTLEKAAARYNYDVPYLDEVRKVRQVLDNAIFDAFDQLVCAAESASAGAISREVSDVYQSASEKRDSFLHDSHAFELIRNGYQACGFSTKSVDLFRK